MDNTIYGDVKFIIPTYVVETKKVSVTLVALCVR